MNPIAKGRRLLAACATLVAAFAATLDGAPARAQDFDMTMSVIVSPGDAYSHLTGSVPDRIAKATEGRVKVTVSDSLVPAAQIAAAVRDGRVPMTAALHTYLAADEPRMGIFNLPGLIDNIVEYKFVCDAFWCEDTAQIWLEQYNAIVLAEGAWCTQQLFSKEPIRTLEDFKNKRLRVHNPQTAALMDALGAKPVALPVPEIMPALERGVIDGLFTSTCVGEALEFWRVAKYVQNWSLGSVNGWAILINKDEWAKIPPELQAAIQTEMDALEHEAFYDYYAFVQASMDRMKEHGVTFWVAPKEERDRVTAPEYVQAAYDSWYARAKETGTDGEAYIKRIREVLGKNTQQ